LVIHNIIEDKRHNQNILSKWKQFRWRWTFYEVHF